MRDCEPFRNEYAGESDAEASSLSHFLANVAIPLQLAPGFFLLVSHSLVRLSKFILAILELLSCVVCFFRRCCECVDL